jgi:hypothetical protein
MTTHLQALLRSRADSTLFSGRGDGERDGRSYLVNGFDCLLAGMAEALVKDGVDRETIMSLFVSHAQEVLDKGAKHGIPDSRKNAGLVVQKALRQRSIYDENPEKVA